MCSLGSWIEVKSRARYFGRTNQIRRRCKQTLFSGEKKVMLLCEGEGKRSPQWNWTANITAPKGAFCFENNRSLWSLRTRAEWKPAFMDTIFKNIVFVYEDHHTIWKRFHLLVFQINKTNFYLRDYCMCRVKYLDRIIVGHSKGGSRHKNWCMARVLGFLIRYFSNYYTLLRSEILRQDYRRTLLLHNTPPFIRNKYHSW